MKGSAQRGVPVNKVVFKIGGGGGVPVNKVVLKIGGGGGGV